MAVDPQKLSGIWSATPTPLTHEKTICETDIDALVQHHLRLGIRGLFVAGTCGEGPWLPRGESQRLLQAITERTHGRMVVAAQVTDNSAGRILENAEAAARNGADIAVIAAPHFLLNATDKTIEALYREAIRKSPLPVGIYDLGPNAKVPVPDTVLRKILDEENVILLKDSSLSEDRRDIALQAREQRPGLRLLTGYEFDVVSYLKAGYDGCLLGGGIFNGYLAGRIRDAVAQGNDEQAEALQKRMNQLMWDVYGGKTISCWLTGLKELLVRMNVFSTHCNILDYPLTEKCSRAIDDALERDKDVLFPQTTSS